MKAITLTLPWASLIAGSAKRIETRSWNARYRGPLAIYAGARLGPVGGQRGLVALLLTEPFRSVLVEAAGGWKMCAGWSIPSPPVVRSACGRGDHRLIG